MNFKLILKINTYLFKFINKKLTDMNKKEALHPEKNLINEIICEHNDLVNLTMDKHVEDILSVVDIMFSCLSKGGTIFWCGNGGSASTVNIL